MKQENVLNLGNARLNVQIRLVSLALFAMTVITFGFAISAVPISGANVVGEGIPYPYLDTLGQFPKDYAWQVFAIIQLIIFIRLFSIFPNAVLSSHRHHADTARAFALASGIILIIDYYVQFSVVPIGLRSGELDGLPLLIQYNSHGLFMVLEEIGYIMMSAAFIFMGQCFVDASRKIAVLRWILRLPLLVGAVIFALISVKVGLDRKDSLEIWILSIDWLVMLVATLMLQYSMIGLWRARHDRHEVPTVAVVKSGTRENQLVKAGKNQGTAPYSACSNSSQAEGSRTSLSISAKIWGSKRRSG